LAKPDPFAEAALTNAAPAQPKKARRGPSLFERMTGGGRSRKDTEPASDKVWDAVLSKEAGTTEKPARPEPRMGSKPAAPVAQKAAEPAEPVAAPAPVVAAKESVKKETPAEPQAAPAPQGLAPEPEEDLLEIPAFLRRQAN
jgi:cell division protein FtsZ